MRKTIDSTIACGNRRFHVIRAYSGRSQQLTDGFFPTLSGTPSGRSQHSGYYAAALHQNGLDANGTYIKPYGNGLHILTHHFHERAHSRRELFSVALVVVGLYRDIGYIASSVHRFPYPRGFNRVSMAGLQDDIDDSVNLEFVGKPRKDVHASVIGADYRARRMNVFVGYSFQRLLRFVHQVQRALVMAAVYQIYERTTKIIFYSRFVAIFLVLAKPYGIAIYIRHIALYRPYIMMLKGYRDIMQMQFKIRQHRVHNYSFSAEGEIRMNDKQNLLAFTQKAVRTRSYSNEEGDLAYLVREEMLKLGYDSAFIDSTGNVVGIIGSGTTIIHFDSHMDTVAVNDAEGWQVPPFSGEIADGYIWGRGSVDMKSALCASVYAAARARDLGYTEGKTIYVTGTVCEEYCDGENLKHLYRELSLKPDYCVICEPSDNIITLGHKGKAQVRIKARGVSAHGSAPEKGVNAVYEMAEIISRVDALNKSLYRDEKEHGTVVLSDISCVSASLNAVPSECSIYLDRRLARGETLELVEKEMAGLVSGKNASWETGTLRHTSWKGRPLEYEPMHNPWRIDEEHPLTLALIRAYRDVFGQEPQRFDFWDFGTNAVTPVAMGIPVIGFGPGEYKLAHMINERCAVGKIEEACSVYCTLIREL